MNLKVVHIDVCPEMLVRPLVDALHHGMELWFGCAVSPTESASSVRIKEYDPIVCGISACLECDNGCGGDAHGGLACVKCGFLACQLCAEQDALFETCGVCDRPVCGVCSWNVGHAVVPYTCRVCSQP